MAWYISEREWDPIPAQSFSRASPPHFNLFRLSLLATVRSKFGFLWEGNIEVHLAAYAEGTGKNEKGSLEVHKKSSSLPHPENGTSFLMIALSTL